MANTSSARKRARQAIAATKRNASQKSRVKTFVKKVLSLAEQGNKDEAISLYKETQSLLDKSVHRNLFHKNKVARTKKAMLRKIKLSQETKAT